MQSGIIPAVIALLRTGGPKVKREVARTVTELCKQASRDQLKAFVDYNCVCRLCDIFVARDPTGLRSAIEAIQNILKVCFCMCSEVKMF